MPSAKVAALHSTDSVSFPTAQRSRQKARKEAGHIAKKRPQVVEDHHDDCGEDFSPLGEDYVVTSYYEDMEKDDDAGEDHCALDWSLGLAGSDIAPTFLAELAESGQATVFDDIEDFARWDASSRSSCPVGHAETDDVAQICGGA